jgi:hypothetical protein
MTKTATWTALLAGLAIAAAPLAAQQPVDRGLVIPIGDASRPAQLRVDVRNRGINVRTHSGKEIILQAQQGGRNRGGSTPSQLGLNVEGENNVIRVSDNSSGGSGTLLIQVPAKTNLILKTVNGGAIVVDGVDGEVEIENTNGGITLTNVAGSVVAHATNGRVAASLREITSGKPMSFTSMNGNVEITLPASAKANVRLRSDNGQAHTDFPIELRLRAEADPRSGGAMEGTINGGGPEIDLRTLNGNIHIRKGR